MQFKLFIVTAPLALLAACGGSGTDDSTSQGTGTEAESTTAASPASPAAVGTEVAAQTAAPAAFAQCRTCHSIEPGRNGVGPTLFGIVGSKAGEVEGYSFSPALAQSGIVWDRASLDEWLQGPMKMVPGTKMVIAQPDPEKRKAIIDYLETLK